MKDRYKVPPHAAWRRVDDEIVILDLNTSVYYSLNETAARMWELLAESTPIDEVIRLICEEYETAPRSARRDLDEFVKTLRRDALLVPA